MDHGLCRQTVTVYHRAGNEICRQVAENCHYTWQDVRADTREGTRLERKFLLILPGSGCPIFPGDRVLPGVGPEITPDRWATFLPVNVPGLSQVEYVKAWPEDGPLSHREAGRK